MSTNQTTFFVADITGAVGSISKENLDTTLTTFDFTDLMEAGETVASLGQFSINSAPNPPSGIWQTTPFLNPPPTPPADTKPLTLAGSAVIDGGLQAQISVTNGTPGITYVVSFVITTSAARSKVINYYVVVNQPVNPSMISSTNPSPSNTTMNVSATAAIPLNFQGSVFVNNTSGAGITITLPPSPVLGQTVEGMDDAGNAGTFPITWVGAAGVQIAGTTGFAFNTSYQSARFQWNGSSWSVL